VSSACCVFALVAGCSHGASGGKVGETGQVAVVANHTLPAPAIGDIFDQSRPYLIGPQDVLIVDVFGLDTLADREIAVDASGRISLPLAGSIPAAGSTPEELTALIAARLRESYVREPVVSVN